MKISDTNRLLVVDPDRKSREEITRALEEDGHYVAGVGTGKAALDLLSRQVFQLIVTELDLPDASGQGIISYVREQSPTTPVIIVTSDVSVNQAVESMRRGAFDFQQKPVNPEHLQLTVNKALEKASLHHAYFYLRHEQPYLYSLDGITAESPAMRQVLKQVSRLAPTDVTVMITGETGTGKSLIAGAIHANSPRRDGTLVTVNCAALTETLLESELFGHEKGAFTGAHKAREGRFQQAHGGTLFLDEVGEMSPAIQAKVLRAIEDQLIYRLGGSREIHVNVRIIAATNTDLGQAVRNGSFRKDLFYRLNVAPLHIPPLRERRQDILPLAHRFMKTIFTQRGRGLPRLNQEAEAALLTHQWPGNIRELRNVVERSALFADSQTISPADLGIAPAELSSNGEVLPQSASSQGLFVSDTLDLDQLEKQALIAALERSEWVQKEAAALVGITERRMSYKLNKYNIRHPSFRAKRRRRKDGTYEELDF